VEDEDKRALDDIERYGCHILTVMEGDGEPCFAYSIGIEKKQDKPDLVILGLKSELAHSIINNYNDRLRNGEIFEEGKYYSDFLGNFDVCFVGVDRKHYDEYFGWGQWLNNGNNFQMLQMVWPTTDGVWPWNIDKSDFYKWSQPILNESGGLSEI
jgi:hypothetical protein